MPLSRERMRERKRQDRVKPMSNLTTTELVKPSANPVKPTASIPGLIMEGNRIVGVKPNLPLDSSVRFDDDGVKPIPKYNPSIHRAGDRVLLQNPYNRKWTEMVIPMVDAEGNAMPGGV